MFWPSKGFVNSLARRVKYLEGNAWDLRGELNKKFADLRKELDYKIEQKVLEVISRNRR